MLTLFVSKVVFNPLVTIQVRFSRMSLVLVKVVLVKVIVVRVVVVRVVVVVGGQ